jgi:hypothetical protein
VEAVMIGRIIQLFIQDEKACDSCVDILAGIPDNF